VVTLTSDKLTPDKGGVLHERSNPLGTQAVSTKVDRQPQGLAPPGKVLEDRTGLYSTTGWDDTCQEAMYPCLLATVHRSVLVAA
jgi:hypothetical protein